MFDCLPSMSVWAFTRRALELRPLRCIARTIIGSHGGSIAAEIRPSGAVFHVRLPLTRTWR